MIMVYVAGASRNMQRAKAFIERVRAHPHMTISFDWTEAIESASTSDHELTEDDRVKYATADLEGVRTADAVVAIIESEGDSGRGMWVELGAALAFSRHGSSSPVSFVIASGGGKRSIFTALCDLEFWTGTDEWNDAKAFEALSDFADTYR